MTNDLVCNWFCYFNFSFCWNIRLASGAAPRSDQGFYELRKDPQLGENE
jgi:hypothetical protein